MSRTSISDKLRLEVSRRAHHRCEYCLWPAHFSPAPFEVEHIWPGARGGATILVNLAYSCRGCNLNKGERVSAKDVLTGRTVRLYNLRRQRWSKHFVWSSDYLLLIGLTATGRATIDALDLNREELINIRRALGVCGEHPPELV